MKRRRKLNYEQKKQPEAVTKVIVSNASQLRARCRHMAEPRKTKMKPRESKGSATMLRLAALLCLQLSSAAAALSYGQPWPTGPATSIAGLQQTMAQMLQVFSGNESSQLDANHFKLLERDGDFVLVGARNIVYNLSLSTMREQRRLEWPSSEDDIRMCRVKGKSADQCQNYIRVLKLQRPESLIVCGTNAYRPRCRTYLITSNAYELITELSGEGACPYQENQNVTSLLLDNGDLYSATAAQFSGIDGLIHKPPLRTEQFNPKQLNSPNFVNSFQYDDYVYFLFREAAIEYTNCGKVIYSRIGRVCKNDLGGTRANRERFTSFTKARLNCSIPGEYPFYFNEIQASTQIVRSSASGDSQTPSGNQDLLYAVFTTPTNSIGGSAVCAFRMSDVLAAFDGPFKSQSDANSNWLPVAESKVPQPKPGTCVNDSKKLPDENINFLKDNPLMDQTIESVWSQPLVMMASINFRFTQIAVDTQVETQAALGAQSMRTDVIFVGTDDGRVFKLINTHQLLVNSGNQQQLRLGGQQPYYMPAAAARQQLTDNQLLASYYGRGAPVAAGLAGQPIPKEPLPDVSAQTIVVEELHLFDSRTPIVNMHIYYPPAQQLQHRLDHPKLVVLSGKQLKAVPLSRCERALSCLDCLALYDPYCAWNAQIHQCQNVGRAVGQLGSDQFSSGFYQGSRASGPGSWFPANNNLHQQANNYTLAWWQQCPATSDPAVASQQQQVGAPFRSLFSSHLQVPSRFDYASNHHLAHTALISLPLPSQASLPPASRQAQPVSECLTYCGGLYMPQLQQQQQAAAPGNQAESQSSQLMMMNCADYVQQHYIGGASGQAGARLPLFTGNPLNNQSFYTSENLYMAVITCAVLGILMGLAFGYALGRNARKHDSSICSSTFDETNLYMASTGSHHGAVATNLFASSQQQPNHLSHRPQLPILPTSSNHLYSNGLLTSGGGGSGTGNMRSNGSLLHNHLLNGNNQQHSGAAGSNSGHPFDAASPQCSLLYDTSNQGRTVKTILQLGQ